MRWLLLDEVLEIERGKRARTKSRILPEEFSPELLLLEMMAQTGGLLLGAESDFQHDVIFAKIEKARFFAGRNEMPLGQTLQIEAASENLRSEGAWIQGSIQGSQGKIAEAKFLLMNVNRLIPGFPKPITFHEAFMSHFQVRQKVK